MSKWQAQQGGGLKFDRWAEVMRGEFDAFLRQTWKAMNLARKGDSTPPTMLLKSL